MADFFNIDISQLSIFSFISMVFWGAILFGFLWLFKNYLILILIKSPVRRRKTIELLPAIYVIIWILFVLYWLYVLVRPFPFLGVTIILVFAYLSRGYLINLIHGLFFKLKGNISLGQEIAFGNFQGAIVRLNHFDFEIQNKEGEIIQVPYSTMVNEKVIKKDFSSGFSSHKFTVTTSIDISEKDLKTKLLQSPWITQVFPPAVNLTSSEEDYLIYDIIVHLIDDKYQSWVERDLKASLLV